MVSSLASHLVPPHSAVYAETSNPDTKMLGLTTGSASGHPKNTTWGLGSDGSLAQMKLFERSLHARRASGCEKFWPSTVHVTRNCRSREAHWMMTTNGKVREGQMDDANPRTVSMLTMQICDRRDCCPQRNLLAAATEIETIKRRLVLGHSFLVEQCCFDGRSRCGQWKSVAASSRQVRASFSSRGRARENLAKHTLSLARTRKPLSQVPLSLAPTGNLSGSKFHPTSTSLLDQFRPLTVTTPPTLLGQLQGWDGVEVNGSAGEIYLAACARCSRRVTNQAWRATSWLLG